MKGRIEIRPLQIGDLRNIYDLGCKNFETLPCLPAWSETNLAEVLAQDPGISLVAVTKKNIAGFLIAFLDDNGGMITATIRWVYIDRAKQAGLMPDMLNEFKSILSLRNVVKIVIALPESNTELIEYYRNFGFTDSKRFIIMEDFLPKKP